MTCPGSNVIRYIFYVSCNYLLPFEFTEVGGPSYLDKVWKALHPLLVKCYWKITILSIILSNLHKITPLSACPPIFLKIHD